MSVGIVEPDKNKAREWVKRWLGAGHGVSAAVLNSESFAQGRFCTFVADDVDPEQLPGFTAGDVVGTNAANAWLAQTLDELSRKGASCVLVEDDLANRTDPALARSEIPAAFIRDRVVSWSDLEAGSGPDAVKAILNVGSGYPRNAFVVGQSAAELGLADRQQVPEDFPGQVAKSLLAVIVSIFDDESYLVWDPA